MPSNSPNNFLDLEQEYAKLNQDLCRQLGKVPINFFPQI